MQKLASASNYCYTKPMNEAPHVTDVIVIGGGPAGMMAALRARERGKKVTLLEKNNRVGEKLSITGGGRCNIANNEPDARSLLSFYGDAKEFLYSPFSQFGLAETVAFFESHGLPLVTEARKRMFPASQSSIDVVKFFRAQLEKASVEVVTNAAVAHFMTNGNRISKVVVADGRSWASESVILATGGISRPETGSTGEGFAWLTKLGHSVVTPTPNIVPLRASDPWIRPLSGTSLSFMRISFYSEGKRAFFRLGKLLFTHFGLSGPLILNSAKDVQALLEAGPVTAKIDLYPDTEFDALERRVLAALDSNKNKAFKNILPDLVPEGMAETILGLLSLSDPMLKVHSLTKEHRKALIHLLKELPVHIEGLMGMDRAVVSDGGVKLTEVDTKTFRSKIIPNLFLIGDTLHITRPSGGYSLQLCWTSGFVAGDNA
jgi:predicted Rossmann fold flavoprotein